MTTTKTELKKSSRNIGLRDFYVAEVEQDDTTGYKAGTPVKLARAISAKITEKYNTTTFYSDDSVEDVIGQFQNGEIEIEINKLSNADVVKLYDTIYVDGYLCRSGRDKAKLVALGWRTLKADNTYDFEWLYCVKFSERPEREYKTNGESIEDVTSTLKGTFYNRQKEDTIDGKTKPLFGICVDEAELVDSDTTAKEAITDWFSKVQEYTAPTTTQS